MLETISSIVEVRTHIFAWVLEVLKDLSLIQGAEILLTGALVALYWQQKEILQSAEAAEVQIEGYRGGEEEWGSSDSHLQVKLSNIGGGIATNFRVRFETNYDFDRAPFGTTGKLSRKTDGQKEWIRGSGDYLEAGERDETFQAMPLVIWINTDSGGKSARSIPHCLEGLAEEGVEEFELNAWISYTDQLGKEHEKPLFSYTDIPTNEDIETVNELFLHGSNPRTPDVHDYVLPPGTKLGDEGFVEIEEAD